jgi:putative hydroxymethylpyrimidine transport system substrate-binding protein
MKRCIGILLMLVALVASASGTVAEEMTLMLDWFPNVDHLPIYVAKEKGFFAEEEIDLAIVSPSDTADALKLAVAGQVDLAVSYEPQTIIAAAQGLPVRVVGRLVAHPLTTLLYLEERGYTKPADLSGQAIGYTVPGLMDVLLEAFARRNGIVDYTPVNVGFNIVPALTSGQVAAVMGPFKTYETVTMAAKGLAAAYFELEAWGIPAYDELIFICGTRTLTTRPDRLAGFRRAVARGLEEAHTRPEASLQAYFRAVPDVDKVIEQAAFERTRPYFARTQEIDPRRWQAFADFALDNGLIDRAVDVKGLLAY